MLVLKAEMVPEEASFQPSRRRNPRELERERRVQVQELQPRRRTIKRDFRFFCMEPSVHSKSLRAVFEGLRCTDGTCVCEDVNCRCCFLSSINPGAQTRRPTRSDVCKNMEAKILACSMTTSRGGGGVVGEGAESQHLVLP